MLWAIWQDGVQVYGPAPFDDKLCEELTGLTQNLTRTEGGAVELDLTAVRKRVASEQPVALAIGGHTPHYSRLFPSHFTQIELKKAEVVA